MDKQKADEILTEYLRKIYGFAAKKSFSYGETEELCAVILKELYESLLKSDEIYNLEGYVWRISEHVYSKYVQYTKKHKCVSFDGLNISCRDKYDFGEEEEELLRLRREIAFLTKTRREIVYSYYYENKSIAFISERYGLPAGTVKWHLNKARHELKEGFTMERKIGRLGIKPVKAANIGHSGDPGPNGGPEYYLKDSLNLNIVYSVYYSPKTREEIAEELGVTPVYIDDRVALLESNGFLVRKSGDRFTTYVRFGSETYSLEKEETRQKKRLEIAKMLSEDYAPAVIKAVSDVKSVYIPSSNRELLYAAAVFYAVSNKCGIEVKKDLSPYYIRTTDGGNYIAFVDIETVQSDKEYVPQLHLPSMWSCGSMTRNSCKYPVECWSVDSRYSSREGGWQNNIGTDYEYLYEFITGNLADNSANEDKFKRLRERKFLSDDNKVNIMIVQGKAEDFFSIIPELDDKFKKKFADYALEYAQVKAMDYPPQMRDLIISWTAGGFVGNNEVALMLMDILYGNGTFKLLTQQEKITSNLIMFSDVLPE